MLKNRVLRVIISSSGIRYSCINKVAEVWRASPSAFREDGMDALASSRKTGHSLEVPPRSVLRSPHRGLTAWSKAYHSDDDGGVKSIVHTVT